MTRKEAIKKIKKVIEESVIFEDELEAFDMAIKALEQEPCDDCISRQAVLDMMQMRISGKELYKAIYDLPSVSPQQKMGQWIEHFDNTGKWYECDQCHTDWGGPVNYCPYCGAKMEVEE